MAIDFVALTADLLIAHTVTGAYDADAQIAANQYNARNLTRIRAALTGAEIWKASDPAQIELLSAADPTKLSQWIGFCSIPDHDPAIGGLDELFTTNTFAGVAGDTVANLAALRIEAISRATEQGQSRVSAGDIKFARGET